jgi:hypothetical protein
MSLIILLSAVGLIISALVHFSTYVGFDPQSDGPAVWLLHIGVFIVFIPAVWVANIKRQADVRKSNQFWPLAPTWMKNLTNLLGLYAGVNFVIFIYLIMVVMGGGTPEKEPGGYVLRNHGTLVRKISEQEYHRYRAYIMRGFSGHWVLFYALAMTMAASGVAAKRLPPKYDPPAVVRNGTGGRLPIWTHIAIMAWASGVAFMGSLALVLFVVIRFGIKLTGIGDIILTYFGVPLFVTLVLREVMVRWLIAKCPVCGGRAHCWSKKPLQYRCSECNHVEEFNDARIM